MVVVVTLLCLGASHKNPNHNFEVKIEGIKTIPDSSQTTMCIKFGGKARESKGDTFMKDLGEGKAGVCSRRVSFHYL